MRKILSFVEEDRNLLNSIEIYMNRNLTRLFISRTGNNHKFEFEESIEKYQLLTK